MNTSEWKDVSLQYGTDNLQIRVPPWCDILKLKEYPALKNPGERIEDALSNPIYSRRVEDIVASNKKPPSGISAAVAVSDNTRPVPYSGEMSSGILLPLLKRLKKAGIKGRNVKIIVGTGTHRKTSTRWKKKALGEFITAEYEIIDHDCTSSDLCFLADIDGIEVKINRQFLKADIHIITGLVEPHFMAGASGGRKAVCPGLVNLEATNVFHGPEFMDNPGAASLILENNPCHDFSLKVAREVRVDFSVNVVLNSDMELAGVFAGDMEKAHLEAVEKLMEFSLIPVGHEYDVVLTHGGIVAINHYQAAKAACGVIPIIKREGLVILAAHNSDIEPVGKEDYKRVLKVLVEKGPGNFTEFIKSDSWQFTPDQWEVQKWDQFFKKVGSFDRLIYCTTNIEPETLHELPGRSGYDFTDGKSIQKMVQNAVFYAVDKMKQKGKQPEMAFVKEGPYAVPVLNSRK